MRSTLASRRRWLVGSLAGLVAGCGGSPPVQGPTPVPAQSPPVESVTLERYGDSPAAPTYEVTIRRGGGVTYVGKFAVARIGTFRGDVGAAGFDRLAALVTRLGFFDLKDEYPLVPDAHGAILTARAGDRVKAVRDCWLSPEPVELWGLQLAIDGLVAGITEWRGPEPEAGGK